VLGWTENTLVVIEALAGEVARPLSSTLHALLGLLDLQDEGRQHVLRNLRKFLPVEQHHGSEDCIIPRSNSRRV
jgi:hypothetical protein